MITHWGPVTPYGTIELLKMEMLSANFNMLSILFRSQNVNLLKITDTI